MRRSDLGALLAAAASGFLAPAGCASRSGTAPPSPSSVEPAVAYAGSETPVVIRGSGFHVRAVVDVGSTAHVDAGYRAWVGGLELADVRWIDTGTLSARIPPGLAPGWHDLALAGPFGRGALANAVEIQNLPASLEIASIVASPDPVNLALDVYVEMVVSNSGGADALGVAPSLAPDPVGAATWIAGPTPASATISAGRAATFVWRWAAAALGALRFRGTATGMDALSLTTVAATARDSAAITVQRPADLAAVAEILPAAPLSPGAVEVRITVTNGGDAVALGVSPGTPEILPASTATVSLVSGPTRVSGDGDLSRSETVTFSWTFDALSAGTLGVRVSAAGLDANDGEIRSATAPDVWTSVTEEVRMVFADPFGDGTAFTFLFAHAGRLYLGPNRTGAGAVRSNPDGSAAESVAFGFSRDFVDTEDEKLDTKRVHSNPAPPYLSLGYTGCTCDAAAVPPACDCGPDIENARGLFTSGAAGGREWLVAAGARTDGNLKYLYLTADEGPALQFSYVDLRALLSGETATITAAAVFGDRLYVGFSEDTGSGPMLVALLTLPPTPSTPAQPGIEAVKDVDFMKLGLGSTILGKPPTKISWVDAMAGFAGRLYVVNDTGCVVSRTATPTGDFDDCTPSAAAYVAKSSRSPPAGKLADIEPADRAIPQLASWNGRLYAIRNTLDPTGAAGPQLWSCDPARGIDAARCEPGDWTLVAPNTSGDALLTQLGSAGNGHATLLAASATALYVGYDNPGGVQLFRSSQPVPTSISHFRGRDGCIAGTSGCEGLGGNGLGVGARKILDGKALTFGGVDRVYLAAGDGTGPVRVFRIPEGAP